MASVSDAPAQVLVKDDDLALAEQRFEDGSEAFDEDDFEAASDLLAQAVEVKAAKYGEHDIRVVPAYLKYAQALLGCARNQDDNVLGALKVPIQFLALISARALATALHELTATFSASSIFVGAIGGR